MITIHRMAMNRPTIIAFQIWFRQFNFDCFLRHMKRIFWFADHLMDGLDFKVKFMECHGLLPTFCTDVTINWFMLMGIHKIKNKLNIVKTIENSFILVKSVYLHQSKIWNIYTRAPKSSNPSLVRLQLRCTRHLIHSTIDKSFFLNNWL